MLAKDLINKSIPYLKDSDTGAVAINIMETYKITHLPILDDEDNLVGIISESEIFDFNLEDVVFSQAHYIYKLFYVFPENHLFDVLRIFKTYNTTIVPVVEQKEKKNKYLGLISPMSIVQSLTNLPASRKENLGLILKIEKKDYTPTQISNILEVNKAKLLSLIYNDKDDTTEIYLVINAFDVESVIQAFEKYGYSVQLLNIQETKYDELYQERLDNLLHFLDI